VSFVEQLHAYRASLTWPIGSEAPEFSRHK